MWDFGEQIRNNFRVFDKKYSHKIRVRCFERPRALKTRPQSNMGMTKVLWSHSMLGILTHPQFLLGDHKPQQQHAAGNLVDTKAGPHVQASMRQEEALTSSKFLSRKLMKISCRLKSNSQKTFTASKSREEQWNDSSLRVWRVSRLCSLQTSTCNLVRYLYCKSLAQSRQQWNVFVLVYFRIIFLQ